MKNLKIFWHEFKKARFVITWQDHDAATGYEVDKGEFPVYIWQIFVAIIAAFIVTLLLRSI